MTSADADVYNIHSGYRIPVIGALTPRDKALSIFSPQPFAQTPVALNLVTHVVVRENLDSELAHPSISSRVDLPAKQFPSDRRSFAVTTYPLVEGTSHYIGERYFSTGMWGGGST